MNKDKRNNIQLLGTLNNADESGIIANANQVYDANEDKSTQDVSKEHKERIETLETKESSMQTTLENITKTGEASAASNVTYNHNDSNLDATNVQQAIDEVRKRSNYNDGENIIDFNTIHLITDNPEFACVAVDANDRILYGIKTDGQPYFGVGCPKQVKNYIDEQINKILGTDDITTTIDSLKEIETFLKDFTNSDTLKKLLDLKANVDEVRATTNDIYKKSNPNDSEGNVVDTNTIFSIGDNPEYIQAITDSIGRLIEAIGIDGIRRFFAGINVQGTLQCTTDNPEYIAVWLDNQNRIVFGFKINGDPYFGYGVPSQIKEYISIISTDVQVKLDSITQDLANTKEDIDKKINFGDNTYPSNVHEVSDNPEFISAEVDADNKLLETIDVKGNKTFYNNVEVKGDTNIKGNLNIKNTNIYDSLENRVEKEDGKSLIDENIAENLIAKDNLEYLEIKVDNNGKIISSRDINGILYENIGIKTNHLDAVSIGDKTIGTIEEALKSNGFNHQFADWSDASEIHIPIPRCAYINITSSDGTAATWPTTKTANKKYWMQFWDMNGNYFKKRIIFNAQGNSSMSMPKKNGAIDLCNDEWIGDDTFSIKFGDWVAQDSFHVKGYYADYFIGIGAVGYSLFKDIINTRGIYNNRDWKRYLLPSLEAIGTNSQATANLNDNITISNDATCFPQGFPSIVFLDGKFYGIYSWQIKKHRDNYQMKKDNYSEIHLDGMISYDTLFNLNGNLDWDIITGKKAAPSGGNEGFEIRNPKKLICIDGKKYDADTHNVEIIGEDSEKYDSTNADMVNTAKVKTSIINLSKYIPTLQSMVNGGSSNEDIRAKIEEYFDTISIIDYCIFGDLTYNADGYRKNWQWITYNGSKWLVEPYDLDSIFGWNTWGSPSPSEGQLGTNMTIPTGWVLKYYSNELQARYKELRDKKIIDADYILKKLQDNWIERIGSENYKEDHNKWPYNKATYSYAATEYTRKDSIYRVYNWITQRITKCDTLYDYNV